MAYPLSQNVFSVLKKIVQLISISRSLRHFHRIRAFLWHFVQKCVTSLRYHSIFPSIPRPPMYNKSRDESDGHLRYYIREEVVGSDMPGQVSPVLMKPQPALLSYLPPDRTSAEITINVAEYESPGDRADPSSSGPENTTNRSSDVTLNNISQQFFSVDQGLSPGPENTTNRSSDVTLNNISQQFFSVDQGLYPSGNRSSVVLPAAKVLQTGNDIVRIGTTGSSSSLAGVSDVIYPTMPSDIPRYSRERIIDPKSIQFTLKPSEKSFSLGDLPTGWTQHTHPEGQPFFYHREKRIITETWIWDEALFRVLDDFIFQIEDFIRSRNLYQPEDTHLVLDCQLFSDEKYWCGYYYVSHSTRSLFWLEEYDLSGYLSEVKGELYLTHIKLYLEHQYWYHCDLFPNINPPTIGLLDMVADTIRDAQTDVQTSGESTVNYTIEALNEMANVVDSAMRQMKHNRPPSSWFVGRFMHLLTRDRFLNFHGQYGARLSRKQSIHGSKKLPRSWLITSLSPILFSAPNVHLNTMEGIWVDRLTLKPHWADFFVKLNDQWRDHIVHASILLNANVAFLAIPSNDPSNNSEVVLPSRSSQQIASYMSVVTSFASMMLALLLVRQHKTRERGTVSEVHKFLVNKDHHTRGLETLAIMYSLPYALLMWGMVTFFVAFLCMCFSKSNLAPRFVVGIATAFVSILITWCIWMAWEETDIHWRERFKSKLKLLKEMREEGVRWPRLWRKHSNSSSTSV